MLSSEKIKLKNGRSWQIYSAGKGADLVWLHGLGGVHAVDPAIEALAQSYRVIAPVAPGFNDRAELDQIMNIHELVLDYDDLLEELRLDQLPVVGHSFGAMLAAELAAHFPRRPSKLVLLSPLGLWNDAYPVADIFAQPYLQVENFLWHDVAARDRLAAQQAEGQNQVERIIAIAQGLTAVTKFIWPIPDKGLRRRLPRIKARTLIVLGGEDQFVPPAYAHDFAAGIARIQSLVVPGAGHMLPYEKPMEVMPAVQRFLNSE
ncbi:MAG TPA: alpha/beta hydrolase [Candidatus Binataceae bacterium]|nr:alpha/beta hydrolase [Candidatus Binataceae bacterium]